MKNILGKYIYISTQLHWDNLHESKPAFRSMKSILCLRRNLNMVLFFYNSQYFMELDLNLESNELNEFVAMTI